MNPNIETMQNRTKKTKKHGITCQRERKHVYLASWMRRLLFTFLVLPAFGFCLNAPPDSGAVQEVRTKEGIRAVLQSLPALSYEDLPQDYLVYSGYQGWSKSYLMKGRIFYRIQGSDSLLLLVGKYRISHFLPKDSVHYRNIAPGHADYVQYLCLDTSILFAFLDLITILEDRNYHADFTINDGYRYPSFNERTGGALYSQHMCGLAIDVSVGDINGDGIIDETRDKAIVYRILNEEIIGNKGGIGNYAGMDVIHFDLRGRRARW